MELNTISLPVFTQLANVIFEKRKASLEAVMRNSGLFKVETIANNSGNIRQLTEIDLEEYASFKGESDQASRARVQQGYSKNLQSYRIAKDIGISYEMRTQNKYPEVIARLQNLADLAMNRMDLDLAHRVTFGTATSYTDVDGRTIDVSLGDTLALFSTAHTLRGSSTTFRNRLANNPQLSKGALEGMEKLIVEQTYNQFGEKVVRKYDILWTTDDPNTINTAMEYLKSTGAPDVANSGVENVYKGKYQLKILPRVATTAAGAPDTTKAKYWGLAAGDNSTAHVKVWEEPHLKSPAAGNNGEEFATDDWNYGVRAGYGIATLEGSWIKFSSGDGTA